MSRIAVVAVLAAVLLAGCRTARQSSGRESRAEESASLRVLRLDASSLMAVVDIDSPQLVLRRDSAPRSAGVASARRMRVAVVRTSEAAAAVERRDSVACEERSTTRQAQSRIAAPRLSLWLLAAAVAGIILLLWRGIRPRQ